jgi:mono/diheme cytochrome c family protein
MLTLAAALVALAAFAAPPAGRAAVAGDAAAGKKVFSDNCTACHSATTNQTIAGPGLKGLFKNGKMPASGKPVTDANVRNQILNGGNGMPPFKGQLSDADIDNLIAYLKTL